MRALLVDDEPFFARAAKRAFETCAADLELDLDVCHSAREALELLRLARYELIIVDLLMPEMDGIELTRCIRASPNGPRYRILVPTFCMAPTNRVDALDAGADRFITKRLDPNVLFAEVRATIRRDHSSAHARPSVANSGVCNRGRLRVERLPNDAFVAIAAGATIPLTPIEARILRTIGRRRPRLVSWQALTREVWGANPPADRRALDSHLSRLRSKLEPTGAVIDSVQGVGLRLLVAAVTQPTPVGQLG